MSVTLRRRSAVVEAPPSVTHTVCAASPEVRRMLTAPVSPPRTPPGSTQNEQQNRARMGVVRSINEQHHCGASGTMSGQQTLCSNHHPSAKHMEFLEELGDYFTQREATTT